MALKAKLLAERNVDVERKNQEIEQARRALEEKAAELALTSRYKSEFLANMSHELRTPLNSILILGQQLSDNVEQNLSSKQVEFAKTIHGAGTDLLNLISDILDLSKIESGTVTVESEEISFGQIRDTVDRNFRHEAERRSLEFGLDFDADLGRALNTDPKRLLQILKNLLSNAFKFTEQGSVRLSARVATHGWTPDHPVLSQAPVVVAFTVTDSGIGISSDKQRIIFEAFQQADAGTARKFGGTGLGLAISRELATLLGGEIRLMSTPGKGSTFTLFLPLDYSGGAAPRRRMGHDAESLNRALPATNLPAPRVEEIDDDRRAIEVGDPVLLIVEDDPHYGRVLLDLARSRGFKGVVAMRGAEALKLARELRPTAISLDIFLPDMLGWTVLARLKQDPVTRHIPVQIVTIEEERQHGMERGAFSFLAKPMTTEGIEAALDRIKRFAEPRVRRLLVIEDNAAERMGIEALIGHDDVEIVQAATGGEALTRLHHESFDCAVLDLSLPDMSGFDLLDIVQKEPGLRDVPIVVFTGRDLSPEEETRLNRMAKSIVIKGAQSPERLLDETALFLHRVVANLPPEQRRMLDSLYTSNEALVGRKVLVVDDDIRNIFAVSSILERQGMEVITATNGQEAIDLLEAKPETSLILMDIMMPDMDGYQTMRAMRRNPAFRSLPIIALTAKAMKGDREKCLEAGASDYIAKPVHTDQLLATLRQWLHR
jgi:CheY-like chemotaxis protein/signal transduction histidine kinase